MSDKFAPLGSSSLARWISLQLKTEQCIFGIPETLFWHPQKQSLTRRTFDQRLENPFGVAAGPHTQLAVNIVAAWLCGARFIELKTIQTLDDLDIAKPCIDAEDAGFNCEWSQELALEQSLAEYVKAWVLILALQKRLFGTVQTADPGFVFNMSVGYDLKGIQQPNVQSFLDSMNDASALVERVVDGMRPWFPELDDFVVPKRLSNNVTLSTMHGCPPDEIEQIAEYLLTERKLHTNIKLNPTVLGPQKLRAILNETMGFKDITVPDEAFAHDTKFADAIAMIRRLKAKADDTGVTLGLKLTNTLEVQNHRPVFPADQTMMYMSGRTLHPLTVNAGLAFIEELGHLVPISFCGGADAFNAAEILACGYVPLTVCTDLLRPGGYTRLAQYFTELHERLEDWQADDLETLAAHRAGAQKAFAQDFPPLLQTELAQNSVKQAATVATQAAPRLIRAIRDRRFASPSPCAQWNVSGVAAQTLRTAAINACKTLNARRYANEVQTQKAYQAAAAPPQTKSARALEWFDCIQAPCQNECPAGQNVPDYMYLVSQGRFAEALRIIGDTNPLPLTTGAVCDHPCTTKCVRNHYDDPLAIREIKRAAARYGAENWHPEGAEKASGAGPVAIIGGGPAGVSAAYFLLRRGYRVTLFERRSQIGGMAAAVIPRFRLPNADLKKDLDRIAALGAKVHLGRQAGRDFTLASLRQEGFNTIFLGLGAIQGRLMGIEGEQTGGVMDCLSFLQALDRDRAADPPPVLGKHVIVVGGGNSAVDAARVAWRLSEESQVTVLYRRSRAQMPAEPEEIEAMLEEGIALQELTVPVRVFSSEGRVNEIECVRMRLGAPDKSGRPRPIPIDGSTFRLACTSMIVGIGQKTQLDFLAGSGVQLNRNGTIRVDEKTMETQEPGIFAGGDVVRGPSTVIRAAADGRRAADAIGKRDRGEAFVSTAAEKKDLAVSELMGRRARRVFRMPGNARPADERRDFEEVEPVWSKQRAQKEAARCLLCNEMCSLCVTVCPNRANQAYTSEPMEAQIPAFTMGENGLQRRDPIPFWVRQKTQIINLADLCNACGNCRTFCPTAGAPYQDKPRLTLDRRVYEESNDTILYFETAADEDGAKTENTSSGDRWTLHAKIDGRAHRLERRGAELIYRCPTLEATVSVEDWQVKTARPGAAAQAGQPLDLIPAVRLYRVAQGVQDSLPYLFE
jgi:NADPH-dependent glutamate synthase beta subunit-like oxidoreductase